MASSGIDTATPMSSRPEGGIWLVSGEASLEGAAEGRADEAGEAEAAAEPGSDRSADSLIEVADMSDEGRR